ncbi:MAG: hypothetical protein AAGJ74_13250 [Pseudomonadota bacterium]
MAQSLDIADFLGLRDMPNFARTPGSFVAMRRTDIAPLAYEVVVNAPPRPDTLEALVAFADGASPDLVRTLYEACNGMFVGATKFGVYGVREAGIDRSDFESATNTPWSINLPNIYERPASWPHAALIVGVGDAYATAEESTRLYHSIEAGPRICVSPETDFEAEVRAYTSVEDWLSAEVALALADRDRW